MELHFDQELSDLKDELLRLASLAEASVAEALKALVGQDARLARHVIKQDSALDRLEVDLDARCIELIALRQPKARDLRMITMTMRIGTELERVGDQAVSIANRVIELNQTPLAKPLVDIPRMAEIAQAMIRDALDAFVFAKTDRAREIIQRDADMDRLYHQVQRELTELMEKSSANIKSALCLMNIARKLERIGDHATNIAEEVIFLYEGQDVRHQHSNGANPDGSDSPSHPVG